MLTASRILQEIESGKIIIEPFDIKNLNPNSYNCSLGDTLKYYDKDFNYGVLDPHQQTPTHTIKILPQGLLLRPGELYLANVQERVATDYYISAIDGRSSIGRLGINIHATAGFGDIGFDGHYTLEIFCVKPVVVYPGMKIAQIYFEEPTGDVDFLYRGRYQGQVEPTESRMSYTDEQLDSNYYYHGGNHNEKVNRCSGSSVSRKKTQQSSARQSRRRKKSGEESEK